MRLRRRLVWVGAIAFLMCVAIVSVLALSYGTGPGYKRGLVWGDNGWELRWIKASALPPDWDSTFKVVCQVPAEIVAGAFPEFGASGTNMRGKLQPFRQDIGDIEAYAVEIDPDRFSTARKRYMYPVALVRSRTTPEPCIYSRMMLTNGQGAIRVPELDGREVVYVPHKTVKMAVEERLHRWEKEAHL